MVGSQSDSRFMTTEQYDILEGQCSEIVKALEPKHDEKISKFSSDVKKVLDYDHGEGSNIELEAMKCHSALGRFAEILARERHVYNVYKNKYDRFYAQRVDETKMNPKMFRTQGELDGAVIRDSQISRAKTFMDSYAEYLEFIEKSIDNVKTKNFGLRYILDYRKIQQGT